MLLWESKTSWDSSVLLEEALVFRDTEVSTVERERLLLFPREHVTSRAR